MDEPMLRAWMQQPGAPAGDHGARPGRWVAEQSWPSPEIEAVELLLAAMGLRPLGVGHPPGEQALRHHSPETTGQDAGAWCADGGAGDWPVDQRAEDGRSLTFTSEPPAERLEILGFPGVTLARASDRPRALAAVRLCDVAPGGSSLLITRGVLNLTHRDGHDEIAPLEPGRRCAATVRLDAIGQAIPAGRRLRVAISTSHRPWTWPSPEPVTITVFAGAVSRLALPVRRSRDADAALAPIRRARVVRSARAGAAALGQELLRSGPTSRTLGRDLTTGAHEVGFRRGVGGHRRLAGGGPELDDTNVTTYRIVDGDPDGDGRRVPRHARPRRLRGRRARLRAHVDAAVPARWGVTAGQRVYAAAMIAGAHTILFAADADAARAFFRDVLELDAVDSGKGWLIFALPPGELACHPAGADAAPAELYLMCKDVDAARAELEGRGVQFTAPVSEEPWGRLTRMRVPGFGELGLYEPHHASPLAAFG